MPEKAFSLYEIAQYVRSTKNTMDLLEQLVANELQKIDRGFYGVWPNDSPPQEERNWLVVASDIARQLKTEAERLDEKIDQGIARNHRLLGARQNLRPVDGS